MEKFRLGLIGCGGMMRSHVNGVNQLPEVAIVAVCDIIEEKARVVAESLEGDTDVKVFTNYRDMVDEVDGVLIALPHNLHFPCGMYFALNKKHVLMEKPLCNSEEECLRLIRTCDEMGVTLMCAYPVPYWPGIVEFKKIIDSGKYGKPFMFSVWTEQLTGSTDNYNGMLNAENPWGRTTDLGGGQLFSHGCHYIDLMLWIMGNPLYGSHVGTNVGTPWMLREGTSAVVIKFENGAVGYHGATWGARGTRQGYDFQMQMEGGMLEYDRHAGEIRIYNKNAPHLPGEDTERPTYTVLWKAPLTGKDTQHEIRHFVECATTGKKPDTDGRRALQGLRVIWKLYNAEDNNMIADLRGLGLENAADIK